MGTAASQRRGPFGATTTSGPVNPFVFYGSREGVLYSQRVENNTWTNSFATVPLPPNVLVGDLTTQGTGTLLALSNANLPGVTAGLYALDVASGTWKNTNVPNPQLWSSVSVAQDGSTLLLTSAADGTLWLANYKDIQAAPVQSANNNPPSPIVSTKKTKFVKVIQLQDESFLAVDYGYLLYTGTGPATNIVWTAVPTNNNINASSVAQAPSGALYAAVSATPLVTATSIGAPWTTVVPSEFDAVTIQALPPNPTPTPPPPPPPVAPSSHSHHSSASSTHSHHHSSSPSSHSHHSSASSTHSHHHSSAPSTHSRHVIPKPSFVRNFKNANPVLCSAVAPPSVATFQPEEAVYCSASSASLFGLTFPPRLAGPQDCWCVGNTTASGQSIPPHTSSSSSFSHKASTEIASPSSAGALSAGAIAGICVAAAVVIIACVVGGVYGKQKIRKRMTR
jgi:hypothetical protein